ncbi:MAG: BTAD domain-containing putative transcriptional regulator, partial [Actinophytocola sp.]|uniref:AfsR/SARP family transcriptional regulator n=1 Tax=Actinophytocola sp. TaxID=1872138 RepID=UPI003D6C5BA0
EYAEAERVRLDALRVAAIEDLAAADLELGRHAEAVDGLGVVVDARPLRERPRELLMLALYRSGRQADALEVYRQTRGLLAGELGIEPGPDLREMHRRVLAGDPTLASTATPPVPPPAQLPPDLPDFTGRAEVLAGMLDALAPTPASVPVIGIVGLAGVGKTALAVHTGHAGDFPDGRLFVDLAASADPLSALLRGMGVAVPEAPGERAALWRTRTAGRRLLVVLDDARDAEQVRPLLPGAGGAAVVLTARRRLFGLDYVRWLKLDGLAEDESVELLAKIAGPARIHAEPAQARRFLRPASGLPQVVRAIGTRLASRPDWTLATAAARIGPPRPDEELRQPECGAIEAPYESALRELTSAQARAFRLLAVPDGPDISLRTAAAVLELSEADAVHLLESLADAHLVEPGAGDRFRYLDPVRTFAHGRALVEDGAAACEAALARYRAAAQPRLLSVSGQ